VFKKPEEGGTVTAGNASQLSDGASATLLMSSERAKQLGIQPLGIYRGTAVAGCGPEEMGIGPVFAVPKLLKRHGLTMKTRQVELTGPPAAAQSRVLEIPTKLNWAARSRSPPVRHDGPSLGLLLRSCAATVASASSDASAGPGFAGLFGLLSGAPKR
jgi:acetyl-CoA acetyltransferase